MVKDVDKSPAFRGLGGASPPPARTGARLSLGILSIFDFDLRLRSSIFFSSLARPAAHRLHSFIASTEPSPASQSAAFTTAASPPLWPLPHALAELPCFRRPPFCRRRRRHSRSRLHNSDSATPAAASTCPRSVPLRDETDPCPYTPAIAPVGLRVHCCCAFAACTFSEYRPHRHHHRRFPTATTTLSRNN